jgi:hypothetical protein
MVKYKADPRINDDTYNKLRYMCKSSDSLKE